ncbi:MAG: hypothetical protein ACM3VS_13750 [Candidatus Dadabacteria bacterium]
MKLSDFILLNANEKKIALLHLGILIGKRKINQRQVFLFHLNNYYVEMDCNMSTKEVKEFRASPQTDLLDPYLETIRIDQLFG